MPVCLYILIYIIQLESINVSNNPKLTALPSQLGFLVKLKTLNVDKCKRLRFPPKVEQPKSLFLNEFSVSFLI